MEQIPLIVDYSFIKNCLDCKDLVNLEQYLHERFIFTRFDSLTKLPYPLLLTQEVTNILTHITDYLLANSTEYEETQLLTRRVFLSLRNCNVANSSAQDLCINNQHLMLNTVKILTLASKQNDAMSVNIISQFLTNMIVGRKDNIGLAWEIYRGVSFQLFKLKHFSDYISVFLYNVIDEDLVDECVEIYQFLLDYYSDESSFYIKELFILFVQNKHFMDCFPSYHIDNRLNLLNFLKRKDRDSIEGYNLSKVKITSVIGEFIKNCDNLFELVDFEERINEVKEITYSLGVILAYSWVPNYKIEPTFLLMNKCLNLLKKFYILRKEGHPSFIPIPAENSHGIKEDDPFYEFETNLVAVLGNLCYKNKEVQDQLKELGFISLVMDCGTNSFDARNPCRKERTVFVIKHLVEGNFENQKAIGLEYLKLCGFKTS